MREGRDLATIDEHIVIKVPFTKDGVRACKALSGEGKKVNVTLIFSLARHREVIEAYVRGLERLLAAGGDPARVLVFACVPDQPRQPG